MKFTLTLIGFFIIATGFAQVPELEKEDSPKIADTLRYYCFYEMDDKAGVVISTDSTLKEWMVKKEAEICLNKPTGNLFDHYGTGPNGSEWNPNNAIYICVYRPNYYKGEKGTIRLNNDFSRNFIFTQEIAWIRFSHEEYSSIIKNMDRYGIEGIFGLNYRDDLSQGKLVLQTDVDFGYYFSVALSVSGIHMHKYVHVSYGE